MEKYDNEQPNYYAIIPANVRYDRNLKANEKLLYGEITALCNKNGFCFATNSYFANLYDVTNISISNWISNLEKQGYIKTEIIYKNNTKEIDKRLIYINTSNTPLKENFNRYSKKLYDPLKEKFNTPIKENFKDNNTSNEYYKNNNINNIVDDLNFSNSENIEKDEENEKYEKLAEGIKEIVENKKKIKITVIQIKNWGKEIKKLFNKLKDIRGEEVALVDIQNAIQFLIEHEGEEYIPVVESGKTFCEKFLKIEEAIKRYKKSNVSYQAHKVAYEFLGEKDYNELVRGNI